MSESTQSYVREYFNDNYAEQFAALRDRYHTRTREALQGRKIDRAPVPNATTIVFLHDDGDGGEYVTTGDFVAYFNHRYGGSDRIRSMKHSLENAVRKSEMRRESEKRRGKDQRVRTGTVDKSFRTMRTVRPGFSLLHALFAIMLVISIGILGGTSMLLDGAKAEVIALEEEVAMLEATSGTVLTDQFDAGETAGTETSYPALDGGDAVYHYPAINGGGTEWQAMLDWFK